MKYVIILAVLLTGCSGGGGSDTETTVVIQTEPLTIESMLVIGDSLCQDGWPDLMNGFIVTNSCVNGTGLVKSFKNLVPVYEHEAGYYDYTVISLGVNDAAMNVDPVLFELAYMSLYDAASNPVCVLPPLTDHANIQSNMMNYHRIILSICDKTIKAPSSDHEDGIHYTPETDRLMAERVDAFLRA